MYRRDTDSRRPRLLIDLNRLTDQLLGVDNIPLRLLRHQLLHDLNQPLGIEPGIDTRISPATDAISDDEDLL